MRIIPAIDIIDGKCVRLSKGDYSTKIVYNENPLEVAKNFADLGFEYLHLVDLDGAKSDRLVNGKILLDIATGTNLKIDFGGGIKSENDLRQAFDCGASQVTVGSFAKTNPDQFLGWIQEYGNRLILGADCRNRRIATNAWLADWPIDVIDYILNFQAKGVQTVICTDIAKDGMLAGPSTNLYREIIEKTEVDLIASGGVSSVEELKTLQSIGCEGAIIGKAIYEGQINLETLQALC